MKDLISLNRSCFAASRLEDGEIYFLQGRVVLIKHVGQTYLANVQGEKTYETTLRLSPLGEISGLTCSCPFAERGFACKHEAALLYYVDAHQEEELAKELGKPAVPHPSNDPVNDISTMLSRAGKYDILGYLELGRKLLKEFDDKLNEDQKLEVRLSLISDSLLHGAYGAPRDIAALSYDFLKEAPGQRLPEFLERLYRAIPSLDAKAHFLHLSLGQEPYQSFFDGMALKHLFPGNEFTSYCQIFKGENPFLPFGEAALQAFGETAFLSYEASLMLFDACMAKGQGEAIIAFLRKGRIPLDGRLTAKLMAYFSSSGDRSSYIDFMNSSIESHSQSLAAIIDFYHSLSEEEKASEGVYLRKLFAYGPLSTDMAVLTGSGSLSAGEFAKLSLIVIAMCDEEIKAFGERFYEKPILRRLEKVAAAASNSDSDLACAYRIIERYADTPSIYAYVHSSNLVKKSFLSTDLRKRYLRAARVHPEIANMGRF